MINEKDFLEAGFLKTEDNLFLYSKELVSKKEAEKHDIEEDEIPTLGNAPNIYGDISYYYSKTDSFILLIPPQIILTLFSGFGVGGDFSGGGASGDW